MILAQSGLFWWKKNHKRSYELVRNASLKIFDAMLFDQTSNCSYCNERQLQRIWLQVTLLGLWIVPAVISFYMHFWKFLGVWVIYSAITMYMLSLCSVGRMERSTPRRVRHPWPF